MAAGRRTLGGLPVSCSLASCASSDGWLRCRDLCDFQLPLHIRYFLKFAAACR
jgi:hypothetical protein